MVNVLRVELQIFCTFICILPLSSLKMAVRLPLLMESIDSQLLGENIIFCGNFTVLEKLLPATITKKRHQVAVQSEDWILSNESSVELLTMTKDNKSVTFLYLASTIEKFNLVFDMVTTFFVKSKLTGSWTANQRLFYLIWPTIDPDSQEKSQGEATLAQIMTKAMVIPRNEHVYVMLLTKPRSLLGQPHEFLVQVHEMYGIKNSSQTIFNEVKGHLRMSELLRISPRRNNFYEEKLVILAMNEYPAEVELYEREDGVLDFKDGACVSVLKDFVTCLNFTTQAKQGVGWIKDENETLAGIGHQILNYEADICITTETITEKRVFLLQFLPPVSSGIEAFAFFQQPSIASARNIFAMPFEWPLWATIFFSWLLLLTTMYLLTHKSRKTKWGNPGTSKLYLKYKSHDKFPPNDVFLWVLGVFCQQGWRSSPWRIPLRIVFLTTFMTGILIYNYYNAAIVSVASAPSLAIRNFQDFKKYGFQVFTNPSILTNLIGFVQIEAEKEIKDVSDRVYVDDDNAVEKVLAPNSKMVYITNPDNFYTNGLEHHRTELALCKVDKMRASKPVVVKDAMFLRKGSEFQEIFFVTNIMIMEKGLMKRYWRNYKMATELHCLPPGQKMPQLSILDCYSVFVLILMGLIFSFLVFILERSYQTKINFQTIPLNLNSFFPPKLSTYFDTTRF